MTDVTSVSQVATSSDACVIFTSMNEGYYEGRECWVGSFPGHSLLPTMEGVKIKVDVDKVRKSVDIVNIA